MKISTDKIITISFLTLAFSRLWHVFNMRSSMSTLFRNDVVRNRFVWGAIVLCVLLIVGVLYMPPVASVLQVEPLSWPLYLFILLMSAMILVTGQVYHHFRFRNRA